MRDPSKFRLRFKEYKEGKSVREIYGLPGYQDGLTSIELQIVDNQGVIRQGYPEIPIDKARAWSDKKYTGNSGETFVKNFANNLISTVQDAVEPYREALNLRLTPQGAFRILMDAGMSKAGQAVGKLISDAAKPVTNAVSKSESVAYLTPSQMGRRIKENPLLVSSVNVDDAIKDAMWFHENLVLPAWESRGVHIGLDPKDFSIKQADFGDSKLGAIISEDGDIILNSKLPPERQALVIEHEFGGHGAELLKRKIKKLYPKQASLINKWDAKDLFLVNQAYNYSDEFLTPRPGFPKAEESVVLNREVQYLISRDNGWAVGPELLLIIKLMPRARLRRYYAEANAYGKEIIKNAKDPDLMPQRTALMNVPVFSGGLYLSNTDPNKYKNGKLPRYNKGKTIIGSNVSMNDDDTFTDDYTRAFDDLIITPKGARVKPGELYKYQEPYDSYKFFNTITLGGLNNLSPAQWARRVYDTGLLIAGNKSLIDWTHSIIDGNTGIVPTRIALENPYAAIAANGLFDLWALGGYLLLKLPFSDLSSAGKVIWNNGKMILNEIPIVPGNFYRIVRKDAIQDAKNTGIIRGTDQYKGAPYFSQSGMIFKPVFKDATVIEGTPLTPVQWTSAFGNGVYKGEVVEMPIEMMTNPKPSDMFPVLKDSRMTNVIPWYNESYLVPTTGFSYWQKHPLIGWRRYQFNPDLDISSYKDGKIAIKPANRGKFNATKKRTGKTTEELTHSKNPLTRKRAIFALNSRKWSHK